MKVLLVSFLSYLALAAFSPGHFIDSERFSGSAKAASPHVSRHSADLAPIANSMANWGWDLSDYMPATGSIGPAYLLSDGQPVVLLDRGSSFEKPGLKGGSQRYLWYPFTGVFTAISIDDYRKFVDAHRANLISKLPIFGFNSLGNGLVIEHGFYKSMNERCYLNFQEYYSIFHGTAPNPIRSFLVLEYTKPHKIVASESCNNDHNTVYNESVFAASIEVAPLPDHTLLIWSFPNSNFVLRLDSSMYQKTTLGGRIILVDKASIDNVFKKLGDHVYDLLSRYRAIVSFLHKHNP